MKKFLTIIILLSSLAGFSQRRILIGLKPTSPDSLGEGYKYIDTLRNLYVDSPLVRINDSTLGFYLPGNVGTIYYSDGSGALVPLAPGSEGQVVTIASGIPSYATPSVGGTGWLLPGNAGTDTATNFVGTTDDKSLMFRIGNDFSGVISKDTLLHSGNTALGWKNLYWNTTGNLNTAIGAKAMYNNTTGSNNTATGRQSLFNNATGSDNTGFGYWALHFLTNGSSNTAVGLQALAGTGVSNTGSSNTAVGNVALLSNTTGFSNSALGSQALNHNTTGNQNTAVGDSSLLANTTGSSNAAGGYSSMRANLTGSNNAAWGVGSLQDNTASNNAALGYQALTNNTSGTNNTATGMRSQNTQTTGSNNTSSGANSLYINNGGFSNTAMGYFAVRNTSTGHNNSGFGDSALFTNSTGSNNAAFGNFAGAYSATASNSIFLNTLNRTNVLGDTTNSVFYSLQSATAANQITKVGGGGLVGINIFPSSTLDASAGSFAMNYTASAVDITATIAHHTIDLTATGKTVTLPTAVGITGREYTVKLTASGSGTVATTSSQTIDASTTYSLSAQYKYVTVQSNGANWIIIGQN